MKAKEFAERVERLCEFLLDKMGDSEERETIIKLKEEAANLQSSPFDFDLDIFKGLTEHMRGFPGKDKES